MKLGELGEVFLIESCNLQSASKRSKSTRLQLASLGVDSPAVLTHTYLHSLQLYTGQSCVRVSLIWLEVGLRRPPRICLHSQQSGEAA